MKILIFSTAYLPFVGGAELAIKEITERLPVVSFTLITARLKRALPTREQIGNVDVYRVGFGTPFDKWLLSWLGFRKAKQLEKEQHIDAIWSVMASQASIAAAWFKKAFPSKKLVLTLQEGDEEEHLKRYAFGIGFLYRLLIRPWHTLVFKRADVITAISNYLAERARKNNPNVRVEVIPNGVSIEKFEARNPKSETNLKSELGIKENEKVIITTSRLVPKNGIGDLIEAMRYLPEDVKLIICGDGSLLKNLQLLTYNLQLTGRVKFLGLIAHPELPHYLHISDIFVRASRSEGMGSSFIEAMAAGLPVVATSIGGIVDFLFAPLSQSEEEKQLFANSRELANRWGEKITGLFCVVENAQDIAAKIQLLLSSDKLRNRIIANASKMVREKYEWSGIAEKMKEVFDTATARV